MSALCWRLMLSLPSAQLFAHFKVRRTAFEYSLRQSQRGLDWFGWGIYTIRVLPTTKQTSPNLRAASKKKAEPTAVGAGSYQVG